MVRLLAFKHILQFSANGLSIVMLSKWSKCTQGGLLLEDFHLLPVSPVQSSV